jgi:hypothetical protein
MYPWGAEHPSNAQVTEPPPGGAYGPGPARHNLCWSGDETDREIYPTWTSHASRLDRYTFDEYLALEASSTVRHGFLAGEIYAMAGVRQSTPLWRSP